MEWIKDKPKLEWDPSRLIEVDFTDIHLVDPSLISKLEAKTPLSLKERVYLRERFQGATRTQARKEAHIGPRKASLVENNQTVQDLYRLAVRQTIPMEEIVLLIKGGAHATIPGTTHPDWKTRKPYVEMAVEHSGYLPEKTADKQATIQVVVQHIGSASVESAQYRSEVTAQADPPTIEG